MPITLTISREVHRISTPDPRIAAPAVVPPLRGTRTDGGPELDVASPLKGARTNGGQELAVVPV